MATERYDLLVIGGGIHGAGVAQAAAAGGYSVLLLEQTALAGGTSSRSSKLIHGGLRYLETGQLSLVRECLRERERLLTLAPQLVRMCPFHIPVYRNTRHRPWQLRLGLSLYALLAGLKPNTRFQTLPRPRWQTLDGLDTTGLQAVFRYQDAQTDDAALTRAVMDSAIALGAVLSMPSTFLGAHVAGGECVVRYSHHGEERSCKTGTLVNAAGPWVNRVLDGITPPPEKRSIDLVQGAHIVIAGELTRGIYYLEAPQDRRAVFVMPWRGRTLVGTTETVFRGNPADVSPLAEEKEYLLEVLRRYFPRHREVRQGHIVEAFAGLRVLPTGKGPAQLRPRETVLHMDPATQSRVLTIYGGKLTAYRATAEKVLERLAGSLPRRAAVADTRTLPLNPHI